MEQQFTKSQPEVWDAVWRSARLTPDAVQKKLARELRTLRWQAIRDAFTAHFGTLRGLRTIELGAGTGDISLLLAREGADTTLFDANQQALDLAQYQFAVCGLASRIVMGNFLNLDQALFSQFDAAVSYGTVEHFSGDDRQQACMAHVKVIHSGGMVAISVPNAHCLPYRLNKWRLEHAGKWPWGLEIPYTRAELARMAEALGLKQWFIHGSSFLRDWDQFLLTPVTSRVEKYTGFHFERRTPFDPYWGHALTLIGERS